MKLTSTPEQYSYFSGGGIYVSITISSPNNLIVNGSAITPVTPATASTNSGQSIVYSASGLPSGLSINSSTGEITGTPSGGSVASVTITASSAGRSASASINFIVQEPSGEQVFSAGPSTQTFTVPSNVTLISMVGISGGGGKAFLGGAGGGGALAWVNNYPVTPGQTLQVFAGKGGISQNYLGPPTYQADQSWGPNGHGSPSYVKTPSSPAYLLYAGYGQHGSSTAGQAPITGGPIGGAGGGGGGYTGNGGDGADYYVNPSNPTGSYILSGGIGGSPSFPGLSPTISRGGGDGGAGGDAAGPSPPAYVIRAATSGTGGGGNAGFGSNIYGPTSTPGSPLDYGAGTNSPNSPPSYSYGKDGVVRIIWGGAGSRQFPDTNVANGITAVIPIVSVSQKYGIVGTAISYQPILAFGGNGSTYTYSITTGTLPTGLSLNSSTGVISGTPSASSAYATYTMTIVSSGTTTAQFSMQIYSTFSVSWTGTTSFSYYSTGAVSQTLGTASGGTGTGRVFIITPTLPTNLSFDTTSTTCSMTHSASLINEMATTATTSYTIKAYDAFGTSLQQGPVTFTFSLTIIAANGLLYGQQTFTTTGAQNWVVPNGVSSISMVAVGGGGGGGTGPGPAAGSGGGGGGGALAYFNNYPVVPGETYTVTVGSGGAWGPGNPTVPAAPNGGTAGAASSIVDVARARTIITAGGGQVGTRASPTTGWTYGGGGGAGGYAGVGGTGSGAPSGPFLGGAGGTASGYTGFVGYSGGAGGRGTPTAVAVPAAGAGTGGSAGGGQTGSASRPQGGGGVGVNGQGTSGAGGTAIPSGGSSVAALNGGSGGNNGSQGIPSAPYSPAYGGIYGGGGGAFYQANAGGQGAVRIIYPGNTRTFPNTNTGNL